MYTRNTILLNFSLTSTKSININLSFTTQLFNIFIDDLFWIPTACYLLRSFFCRRCVFWSFSSSLFTADITVFFQIECSLDFYAAMITFYIQRKIYSNITTYGQTVCGIDTNIFGFLISPNDSLNLL